MRSTINRKNLESFLNRLDDFAAWDPRKQTDYFAYFLTLENGTEEFSASQIEQCFELASLKKYSRIRPYLSENASSSRGGRYVRRKTGYALERSLHQAIHREINEEPERIQLAEALKGLLNKVSDPQENSFLGEAINCYRVKAFRAAIVMVWILTVHHVAKYVLAQRLSAFNAELAKNTDKRVKITTVRILDDFGEIPEEKFIELCRSASVISNDVRKILIEKLGIRNSAAHPSGIKVDGHKATEFIADLLNNVVLKY